MKKKDIKKKAEQIIKEYGLTVPFSVSSLAKAMGIDVLSAPADELITIAQKQDPESIDDNAPEQILGYFDKKAGIFYINDTNQSMTRQRFTIAHELGHHVLYPEREENKFRKVVLKKDLVVYFEMDSEETDANYFAGYLLMPDDEIEKRLKFIDLWGGGELFIHKIADLFGVSLEAMRIRLKTFKSENPGIWDEFGLSQKLF